MPVTRTDEFRTKDVRLALLARAISHPARVAIIRTLARKSACICGEIVDELPIAQSTVSQHLKELKKAGLVKGTIQGSASCYCLDLEALAGLSKELNLFFEEVGQGRGTSSCSTKGAHK